MTRFTAAAIALAVSATSAHATALLTFGQTSSVDTVSATNNATDTSTTITASTPVLVTSYLNGAPSFIANLNMTLNSNGPISNQGGVLLQGFSGMASWTSGAINYLTAAFDDALFAINGASSLSISASQPPGSITFTSSVLSAAQFLDPAALSFSFADVIPPAGATGTTLGAFTSTISGTSSVNAPESIPEPATLAVMLLGASMFGLGVAKRLR